MKKRTKKIIAISSIVILEVLTVVVTAKIAGSKGYDKGIFDVLSDFADKGYIEKK